MGLFTPKWKSRDKNDRLKWVKEQANPQKQKHNIILEKIAQNDEDWEIRKTAYVKLGNEQMALAEIAQYDGDVKNRKSAVQNLTDQSLLAKVAQNDEDDNTRRVATSKINNQDNLIEIALKNKSWKARKEAVSKIKDNSILSKIIEKEKNYKVLEAIILNDNFTNQKILEKIANGDIEKYGVAGPELAMNKITNKPKTENKESSKEEIKKYTLSINVANVMGHKVFAEFNGTSNVDNEKKILKHFAFSDVLDEIPEAFKMCNIYIGKLVDIQEAAAIMYADMEGVPSANTRVNEKGFLSFQGKEGDVKNCQNTGRLSWAGGSCKLTRTLFPSSQKEKYYLVVVNS